ncbi:MAG TPA: hypothetical protein VMB50_08925, partial [Myxococcales bacterium]|nr:hypothetical protein [Myxococcales bacterium]
DERSKALGEGLRTLVESPRTHGVCAHAGSLRSRAVIVGRVVEAKRARVVADCARSQGLSPAADGDRSLWKPDSR